MKLKKFLILFFILSLSSLLGACSKDTATDSAEAESGSTEADTAMAELPPEMAEPLPPDPSAPPADQAATDAALEQPAEEVPAEVASTPPAVAPEAPSGEMQTYTVRRGDTLMRIAYELYGDIMQWKTLYETNREAISDAGKLSAGLTLKYAKPASEPMLDKNGEAYLIKTGDTLGTIADDIYGKTNRWKSLWENNKTLVKNPNKIYAGFYLYYQITEQERKEAEQIKSQRMANSAVAEPAPVANAPAGNENAAAPAAAQPQQVAPAPQAAPVDEGGLQSLISKPKNNRLPASTAK